MYAVDDLRLITAELRKLLYTTYFREPLTNYTRQFTELLDHVVANAATIGPTIVEQFRHYAWQVLRYLSGSTAKEIPYEVVYALEFALQDWFKQPAIITTALLDQRDFRFEPSASWQQIHTLVPSFPLPQSPHLLVRIALPRLYRQRPLYAVPLYHELGHFIDVSHQVSELGALAQVPNFDASNPAHVRVLQHNREHFADLFCASYCGLAASRTLELIAANHPASPTHPATAERARVIGEFVSGVATPVMTDFNAILTKLGLPLLQVRFAKPSLEARFDAMRPAKLLNEAELHGMFSEGWRYLDEARAGRKGWGRYSEDELTRIINDLVEKSIRNRQITERWAGATT
jgi:hypothetical protein